jgi:hypothetical protein
MAELKYSQVTGGRTEVNRNTSLDAFMKVTVKALVQYRSTLSLHGDNIRNYVHRYI